MNHYIYYSYEKNGRGYIGSRSCICDPKDDNYFGSFKDKTFAPTKKIILAICQSKKERYELEYFYQKIHNVVENPHFANRAFQTTSGFSRLGLFNSEESRKKMSLARRGRQSGMLGKKHTEETKKRISKSLKGRSCPSRGRKWTNERKKKHSECLKGRKGVTPTEETKQAIREKLSKPTFLKNLVTGEFKSFPSQKSAADFIGVKQGAIANLLAGRANRVKEWAIATENGDLISKDAQISRKTKSVKLLNLETEEVKEFKSVKEAAKALNVCTSTISKIMRGRKLVGHVLAANVDPSDSD
jgi:group I intron endonuclease